MKAYHLCVRSRPLSWWRHPMETFSALLAICAGNSPVTGEFPAQRPVTRSFDVFFDFRLNKRLSEQSWHWWFETQSRPLWCHCNDQGQRWVITSHRYCVMCFLFPALDTCFWHTSPHMVCLMHVWILKAKSTKIEWIYLGVNLRKFSVILECLKTLCMQL